MSRHLDLDALADLLADVTIAHQRDHLDSCADCRARLTELGAALPRVTAALAALPVPAEPDDLAARVEAALAAEQTAAEPALAPAGDVLPLVGRPRTRWLPAAAAVAAAAVLVTGGVLVAQQGGSLDNDTAAKGPALATSSSGTDYSPATLAAAVPALLAGGAARTDALSGNGTTGGSAGGATAPEIGTQADAADPLNRLRTTDGLADCLAGVLDPGSDELPLALDYAAYQGKPALVVVLSATKTDKADVFVVGPGCSRADAQLLYFTRASRG